MFGNFYFGAPYFGGGPIASVFAKMVCAAIRLFPRLSATFNLTPAVSADDIKIKDC